jgi:hypothetical protein
MSHVSIERGHREGLAKEDRALEIVVLEDVRRHHQDHGGGHPHQEDEAGDVEAPAHVVMHPGDGQAFPELHRVGIRPAQHHQRERAHPDMVGDAALRDLTEAIPEEAEEWPGAREGFGDFR